MKKSESGFTIIEVVLVLAIAGLIFLVVFLALPQLQSSRRDAQRRADLSKIFALVQTFQGNTGVLPVTNAQIARFQSGYIDTNPIYAPDGSPYQIEGRADDVPNGHALYPDVDQIFYKVRHLCNDNAGGPGTDQIQHASAVYNSVAVWTLMENGGTYCVDNR